MTSSRPTGQHSSCLVVATPRRAAGVLGSVTDTLLRDASVPLLVLVSR
jgi:nucleotide-binding universal stress UspA family protein